MEETLDPALEPVLLKQTFMQVGIYQCYTVSDHDDIGWPIINPSGGQ